MSCVKISSNIIYILKRPVELWVCVIKYVPSYYLNRLQLVLFSLSIAVLIEIPVLVSGIQKLETNAGDVLLLEGDRKHQPTEKMTMDDGVPYLEMKTRPDVSSKENVPVEASTQSVPKDENTSLSLPLSARLQRKKQRVNQDFREDYRRSASQRKESNSGEASAQPQELSLPIKERRSAKARLRDERNREYNAFLKQKGAQAVTRTLPDTWKARGQDPAVPSVPKPAPSSPPPQSDHSGLAERPRRDAATLTDLRREEPLPRRHWGDPPLRLDRRPRKLRSYYIYSDEDLSFGEEEYDDEDEELDHVSRRRAGPKELERREVQAPILRAEESVEESRRTLSAILNPNLQAEPTQAKTSERSRSAANKNMADFSTGLIIGAAEGNGAQRRRKERYRQELLQQMAEQHNNKKKEKELELRVAATGAVDPEKLPDRIKQFGAVSREYERKQQRDEAPQQRPGEGAEEQAPPERPRVAFQSPPLLDYSASLAQLAARDAGRVEASGGPSSEEFRRNMAGTLGEMIAPRVTGTPLPAPPVLPDAYHTPYDEAYYYYGGRNPLDPSLAYYGPGAVGISSYPHLPLGLPPPLKSGHSAPLTHAWAAWLAPLWYGSLCCRQIKQAKDSALLYQEELRQQIRERQERRMREREEQERYDARLEAEMKSYDPWGRGGGGAPLKDGHGNLISDLKRMHRVNEEAYLNPESRWAPNTTGRNAPTPPRQDRVTSPLIMTGHPQGHGGLYGRGNVFKDVPTPQQLHEQDRYKEYLMQQIAEKRRKEADERERQRVEEEREEKRLLEQRAQIQKEYEEEQERRKRKEMEQIAKNEELVRQAEERRREAERRKKEEEERANEAQRQQYERERQARLDEVQRIPSPPIPTLQKKLGRQRTPRPPSAESRHSAGASTVRSLSAPHSPPVPARRNQLRARGEQLTAIEEKQCVISELSALSRQLRNEQRRLERQKLQTEREELDTPLRERHKERPPVDVFDMARLRLQVPAKRPPSKTRGPVNMQNIHDFNQLKYRDSTSREEMRQAYPDPPFDDGSLELQQQALLRQQQRRLSNLRKDKTDFFSDVASPSQPPHHQRLESAEDGPTPTLLQSESAFIDSHAGVFPGSHGEGRGSAREGRGSARERRRLARKTEFDQELNTPLGTRGSARQTDAECVRSLNVASVRERNQHRLTRLDNMSQQSARSADLCLDDEDDLWHTSPPPLDEDRRVSVDTVATEPWLRPGTAERLKNFMADRRPYLKPLGDWEGPSTYHG
ncbi:hypothetical protein ACEWY4_018493 [Coilia grayii]|uniref:Centrosome and spindle pole-associated protein 1 C-terminal domain-containing protein n=1 Tax=Coilia grayii TaxID=363190 RepID=A0ABD1JGG5_9TELE